MPTILLQMNFLNTGIWMTSCPTEGRSTASYALHQSSPIEKSNMCEAVGSMFVFSSVSRACAPFSVIRMWAGEMKRRNTQSSGPMSSGYPSVQSGTRYEKGSRLLVAHGVDRLDLSPLTST